MAVNTYSLRVDGGKHLLPNFCVKEFACKGGSDMIKIDDDLVVALQKCRNNFGKALIIHSAYRSPAHNKAVGGSSKSQHLEGRAADFHVEGILHVEVARCIEGLGLLGIGLYSWGVHVDTRAHKSYWQEIGGKLIPMATFGGQAREERSAVTVESKKVFVNKTPFHIRAIMDKGENYINLRDLVSAIGGTVSYDAGAKRIDIDTNR